MTDDDASEGYFAREAALLLAEVETLRRKRERQWRQIDRILNDVVNLYCSCGGGGPDDGCDCCKIYHGIRAALAALDEADR